MENKVKNIAFYGVMTALALIFSYIESFIPINALIPVPGVKLGLANIVVLFALYTRTFKDSLIVALIRILISGLLFGNVMTMAYSLVGGVLSLGVMALLKNSKLSVMGVSMVGGISHNIGQLIVAVVLTETIRIAYYLPVLLISGMVTGLLMGFIADLVVKRVGKIEQNK